MKIVIWIVQILVALLFLFTGGMKLLTPYAEMITDPNMAWVGDFSSTQIKIIGALEVLGALGLLLPMILKKYLMLVPAAAIGLALTMVGAMVTHLVRGETELAVVNIVIFILAALTAWWRRGYFKS